MRERFGLNFELDFYAVEDLTLIVRRSALLLVVTLDSDAATEIAKRSRGTPRIANRLLRRVRDFAQVHAVQSIGVDTAEPGVGLTVTKKTGNSPERNRIKRRLRAALRACAPELQAQHDYVLVGRREALTLPFSKVVSDLSSAIAKVHAKTARDAGDLTR